MKLKIVEKIIRLSKLALNITGQKQNQNRFSIIPIKRRGPEIVIMETKI